MKQYVLFFTMLACILIGYNAQAQQEQGVNYQAVIHNGSGQAVANQNVGIRFTLHRGTATGTTVYSETQTVMTNGVGLINTVIGTGTAGTGTWEEIAWNEGSFFLEVEADPAGGSTYASLGTKELNAVPFSKQSEGVTMFSSGTQNPDKMIIAHSPSYTDWGLRYHDTTDAFQFVNSGTTVLEVDLGSSDVNIDGDLNIEGEVRTAATGTAHLLPIAYGTINSTGAILSGTGNFTVSKTSTGRYEVSINNESYHYTSYTTQATIISNAGIVSTSSVSGDLLVYTYDVSGTLTDRIFQFVVYKN